MTNTDTTEFSCIPTIYHGVQLKSRFEAQAAFLFDALGWEWKYEPKSFMLPNGVAYTPDFLISERNLFVECRGYSSDKGNLQIEGFAGMTKEGIPIGDDYGTARTFLALMGDQESSHWESGRRTGMVLLLHCIECGWRLSGISRLDWTESQTPMAFCTSCIAPMDLHESTKWDGRERIDRSLIVTVRKGKILLNGLRSEHWDSLFIGCSENGEIE